MGWADTSRCASLCRVNCTCNRRWRALQPYVMGAATVGDPGCNRRWRRLQQMGGRRLTTCVHMLRSNPNPNPNPNSNPTPNQAHHVRAHVAVSVLVVTVLRLDAQKTGESAALEAAGSST